MLRNGIVMIAAAVFSFAAITAVAVEPLGLPAPLSLGNVPISMPLGNPHSKIDGWRAALHDEDALVCKHAALALASAGGAAKDAVPDLRDLLVHDDREVRKAAATALEVILDQSEHAPPTDSISKVSNDGDRFPPAQKLMEPGPNYDGPGPSGGGVPPFPVAPRLVPRSSQLYFLGPPGLTIHWDVTSPGSLDSEPLIVPGRQNFPQGAISRLKMTNIAGYKGVELRATVEIAAESPRTEAFLAHNPIPIQLTNADCQQLAETYMVTKVIYIPDPEFQELAVAGVKTLVSHRLEPGQDAILEADRRGSILAIVRLGGEMYLPDFVIKPQADGKDRVDQKSNRQTRHRKRRRNNSKPTAKAIRSIIDSVGYAPAKESKPKISNDLEGTWNFVSQEAIIGPPNHESGVWQFKDGKITMINGPHNVLDGKYRIVSGGKDAAFTFDGKDDSGKTYKNKCTYRIIGEFLYVRMTMYATDNYRTPSPGLGMLLRRDRNFDTASGQP